MALATVALTASNEREPGTDRLLAASEGNRTMTMQQISVHQIIDDYYRHANAGDWDAWCDLFREDVVIDEQLAGRIEGLDALRPMMAGMGEAYAVFQNVPKEVLVDGDQGAVVAHISARAAKYPDEPIEAEVMNYFRFADGKITYMANYHDSAPFAPFLRQLRE